MVSACSNAKSCTLTLRVIIAVDVMLTNRKELGLLSPTFLGKASVSLNSIIGQRAQEMIRLVY